MDKEWKEVKAFVLDAVNEGYKKEVILYGTPYDLGCFYAYRRVLDKIVELEKRGGCFNEVE